MTTSKQDESAADPVKSWTSSGVGKSRHRKSCDFQKYMEFLGLKIWTCQKKKRKSQQSQTFPKKTEISAIPNGLFIRKSWDITSHQHANHLRRRWEPLVAASRLRLVTQCSHSTPEKISSLGKSCKSGKDKWLIVFYCNNPQNNRNINSNENSEQMNIGLFFSRSSFCNGSLTNHHHKDVLY